MSVQPPTARTSGLASSTGPRPYRLPRFLAGAAVGAVSCALLLALWPVSAGVVWSPIERLQLAGAGVAMGGVVGGLLGMGCHRAGRRAAAVVGLLPAALWCWVPTLPTSGRALERVDPLALTFLLGVALIVWGTVRIIRNGRAQLALGLALLTSLAFQWPHHPGAASTPLEGPGLVLITIDTTRADLVPGFGGDLVPAEMPFMTEWSQTARRFARAYAPTALTGPSHTSILSGLHVLDHGIFANGRTLPETVPWVPEILRRHGWSTQGWVSAAVLNADLGFARGFDRYDSTFERRLRYGHPLFAVLPRRRIGGTGFVRDDAQTVALAKAHSRTNGRTFTWVHLYGPHWPYTPATRHAHALGVADTLDATHPGPVPLNHATDLPEAVREHALALYKAELRTLDDQLEILLRALPRDTRVIVAADHGESMDEHGLLFNHGRLSTTPSARVPLWVRGPGYPPGLDDRTVSLAQIAPTLLELAELPAGSLGTPLRATPEDAIAVTVASAQVFRDPTAPHPDGLGDFASIAVRSGDVSKTASIWSPPQWFRLSISPRELSPLASPPASASPIDRVWADTLARELDAPTAVDAPTRRALEALGYLEPGAEEAAAP